MTARVPLEGDPNREPVTIGPVVGGDGFGYMLVTNGMGLTLRRLSREGQVAETVIVQGACTYNCPGPVPYQLLTDGLGGLLIAADWNDSAYGLGDLRVTRLDGAGGRTDTPFAGGGIHMIGQGGTAYLRVMSGATTVSQSVVDVLTWTPRWSLPVEWSLLAARRDGGAVAQNAAGDQAHFDGTGQLLGTTPAVGLRNPMHLFGGWIGVSGIAPNTPSGLRKVEGTIEDATSFNVTYAPKLWTGAEQYGFGNRANQSGPPTVPKISVKCRPVDDTFPISFFNHCYIVVKNRDGSLQTIEGGEEFGQQTGTLVAGTKDGEEVGTNKSTDPVYYVSDGTPDEAVINCLKTNTDVIRAMHLNYNALGPNSNRRGNGLLRPKRDAALEGDRRHRAVRSATMTNGESDAMKFNSTFTCFVWRLRGAVLFLGACGMACMAASCGGRPVTKDFSVLNTATRIEVHESGLRPLSIVTDPERIKVARDFIKQYEKGWKTFRLQGAAIPQRRFDFWEGKRYLGDFGISPNFLTTEGLYQEAPPEQIAKIAALFELKWPPQ